LTIWAVLIVALTGTIRLATLQGLVKPVRIVGGSMAETFCGDHFELACGECGFACRYDAEYPPTDEQVVCPNCGFENRELARAKKKRGDRVLIDRMVHAIRSPRRWEIVAFRTPGDEDHLAVKRVVGLPDEHVSIRGGDVYVDGELVRKSLDELRAMAMLVHDNAYHPRVDSDFPAPWQAESTKSGWGVRRDTLAFRPECTESSDMDWLTYHHLHCVPSPARRTESAVTDNYGYNQDLCRDLQQIADVMLVCRMCCSWEPGSLAFRARHGGNCFRIVLQPWGSQGQLFQNDRLADTFRLPPAAYARDVKIELALCDRRVLFAIDERVLIQRPYQPAASPHEVVARPVGIGAKGVDLVSGEALAAGVSLGRDRKIPAASALPLTDSPLKSTPFGIGAKGVYVEIRRLQVFRDLYLLDPNRLDWDWTAPRPLDAEEFFVVGDNAPISKDSRHWPQVGLPRRLFLGKVLRRL